MCSHCSGDYCGDYEDYPSDAPALGDELRSHEGPTGCAGAARLSEADSDYEILVSAERMVEIRVVRAGKLDVNEANAAVSPLSKRMECGAGDHHSAGASANHYRTFSVQWLARAFSALRRAVGQIACGAALVSVVGTVWMRGI